MENMIREIQVQVDFYSNRFQADGHRTDREMMEFYQNWLSQLIVDQKNINAWHLRCRYYNQRNIHTTHKETKQCQCQNQELLSPETLHSLANVSDVHVMLWLAMLSAMIAADQFRCLSRAAHSRLFLICLSRLRKMLFGIGRVRLTRPGHDVKLTM